MNSQNRERLVVNPFTGELQLLNDLEVGFTVRNTVKIPFKVLADYTRVYPNITIPVGIQVDIEDNGELIVV